MTAWKQIVLGSALLSLAVLMMSCATVPPAPPVKASVIAKTGDVVHLLQQGEKTADEEFCISEVLPVYRNSGRIFKKATVAGKIRITGYLGKHFLKAVVVEGNIQDGDVAMKPGYECIIRLPETAS